MKSIVLSRWLLLIVCTAYLAFPNTRPDFTVYNSHDSESYIALSKNLIEGRGYTRSLNDNEFIPHTLWPPGMALLLAPAVALSGETINFWYVKYTIIFLALLGLAMTRLYLIKLIDDEKMANWVVTLLALNPYFWHFSRIAMAEIPVFTWVMLSLLLIDRSFQASSTNLLKLGGVGLIVGLGMLLKGSIVGLLLAPLPYLWRRGLFSLSSIKQGLTFTIFFCVPFVLWMMSNIDIDKSNLGLDGVNQIQMITKKVIEDPMSDYKTISEILTTAQQNILWHAIYHVPNHIIPGLFLADIVNLPAGNMLALILSVAILALILTQFKILMPLILSIFPAAILISVMTIGGAERYWFTITSLLLIVCYLAPFRLINNKNYRRIVIVCLTITQLVGLTQFIYRHEAKPYTTVEDRHQLAQLFIEAKNLCHSKLLNNTSNTWTKNEHAFQLITGCQSSMVNVALGRNPMFTRAILYMPKVIQTLPKPLLHEGEYVMITLPEPMTKQQIINIYYDD
jgi:hypothetical protein